MVRWKLLMRKVTMINKLGIGKAPLNPEEE
jgi:hypothetical protein